MENEEKVIELKKKLVSGEITLEDYNNSLREHEDAESAERNRQEEAAEETESSETEEENEAAQEESGSCCEEKTNEEKQQAQKEHRKEAAGACECPKKPYGLYALIAVLALFLVISMFTAGFGLRATGSAAVDDAGIAAEGKASGEIEDPSIGPSDAKVTIVEYSDFECPFCQRAEETVKQVLGEYEGKVRLVYRNYPLSSHENALIAAEAGECANEQGKFWEMHDKMFANRLSLDEKYLKKYAKETGLNEAQFNQCLDSGKYKSAIDKDVVEGNKQGFSGVPAFFINGQPLMGAQPIEEFRKIIDEELAK